MRRPILPGLLPLVFAGCWVFCATSCTIETEQPDIQGNMVRLTFLHTSDIHSRLFPYDLKPLTTDQNNLLYAETSPYGGGARLASLIQRERTRGDRVLYVDSGDPFQGAPIFNYSSGELEFRWLSTVSIESMVIGNHEFDLGTANLTKQISSWVDFPVLAANYIFDDFTDPRNPQLGRYIKPFIILNAKGLRVGIIGQGDVGSMYSIMEGGNSSGITPVDANESVRAYIDFLTPSVDLIVVLSHLGLGEDQELVYGHAAYFSADKDMSDYLNRAKDRWVLMECLECTPGVKKYWIPGVRGIDIILGGHLHILTHPPMVLTDPVGRKVVLQHPGAFAKYLARLDLAVAVPSEQYTCSTAAGRCAPVDNHFNFGSDGQGIVCTSDQDCRQDKIAPYGSEIITHQQQIFPVDSIWCAEPRPSNGYDNSGFAQQVDTLAQYCETEPWPTPADEVQTSASASHKLMDDFRIRMESDPRFDLTKVFGYAPKEVLRRNSGTGGDAALGNMTSLSMMIRRRVEAEFAVTNTLGIRDNLYPGLINLETIFNVFPFENTITVMYLSGREVQEMFDYITQRSSGRSCDSQAQIAGCSFTMNCGQHLRNELRYPCKTADDCCQYRPELCEADYQGTASWECREDQGKRSCYAHPAEDILIQGQSLNLDASYKMATNDYIANGGSGFKVLKRNTTKVYTGIALRDALVEYLMRLPTCENLLAASPAEVDTFALSFCVSATKNADAILLKGTCTCADAKKADTQKCGAITAPMMQFCNNPLKFPIIVGSEDGRIHRKVK